MDPNNIQRVNAASANQEATSKGGEMAVKMPRLVSAFGPGYPSSALADGTGAIVRVAMLINEKGNVESVKIVESTDYRFDSPTLLAARKYKFSPALNKDGVPVKYPLVLPFKYSAKDAQKEKGR